MGRANRRHANVTVDRLTWSAFRGKCLIAGITVEERLSQLVHADVDGELGSDAIAGQLSINDDLSELVVDELSEQVRPTTSTRRPRGRSGAAVASRKAPAAPASSPAKPKANKRSSTGKQGRPTRRRSS